MSVRRTASAVLATAAIALGVACSEVIAPPDGARIVTPTTPTMIVAVAGSTIEGGPAVRVLGETRAPIEGVTVEFTVTAGGGAVERSTSVTTASGIASAVSWQLGTGTSVNTLTATVAGLPPVVFTATIGPGSVAELVAVGGDNQQAIPNTTLPLPLTVRVNDAFGNPIPDVTVTFEVLTGGGRIDGTQATSNSAGLATSGRWTLGPSATDQTARARAGSAEVIFTARERDPCDTRTPLTLGSTVTGQLQTTDCLIVGAYYDHYSLPTTAGEGIQINLNSAAFDALVKVATFDGIPVATNNDVTGGNTTNSSIRLIAAGGVHTITATSGPPNRTGPYTLSATSASPSADNCRDIFIQTGVTTPQTLTATDCDTFTDFYDDQFILYIPEGGRVTITQQSSVFDTFLMLFNPDQVLVADDDDSPSACPSSAPTCKNSQILYTAPEAGYYVISASSWGQQEVGAYTLRVE